MKFHLGHIRCPKKSPRILSEPGLAEPSGSFSKRRPELSGLQIRGQTGNRVVAPAEGAYQTGLGRSGLMSTDSQACSAHPNHTGIQSRDETAWFVPGLSCVWILLVAVILQAAGQTLLQIPDTSESDHIKKGHVLLVTAHKNKATKSCSLKSGLDLITDDMDNMAVGLASLH